MGETQHHTNVDTNTRLTPT